MSYPSFTAKAIFFNVQKIFNATIWFLAYPAYRRIIARFFINCIGYFTLQVIFLGL